MTYYASKTSDISQNLLLEDVEVICLTSDVSIEDPIEISKDVTLDLGGYVLSILIHDGVSITSGTVLFKNGTIVTAVSDPISVSNYETVLTLGENLKVNSSQCSLHIKRRGKLVVDGSDVMSTGEYAAIFVEGFGSAKDNSTLDVISGNIVSKEHVAVSATKGGTVRVSGGFIETQCNPEDRRFSHSSIHVSGARSNLIIEGGDVYSEHTSAVSVAEGSTYLHHGGTVQSDSTNYPAVNLYNDGTSLEMDGGQIKSLGCDGIFCEDISTYHSLKVIIKDGLVEVPSKKSVVVKDIRSEEPLVEIYKGVFHGILNPEYIPEGYSAVLLDNGYIQVDVSSDEPDGSIDDHTPTDDRPPIVDNDDPEIITPVVPNTDPDPDSDTPELDDKESDEDFYDAGMSIKIVRSVPVYGSTSTKHHIYDLVGCATILKLEHNNMTNEDYYKIQFIRPGHGGKSIGFILTTSIRK